MTVLAIDFGTSRIKAAYWDAEKSEAVVLPLGKGGRLYVPSLFHVSKDGKICFGDEAEVMLRHDPHGVVENLKLDLDKPIKHLPNGQSVKSGELMALLFKRVIAFSSQHVKVFGGGTPENVVLSLPSRWDYGDLYLDALEAAEYKGEKLFIREPEAAGLAWIEDAKLSAGDMLVVLDFGGGTVDWACLQIDEKGRPGMVAEFPPGGITAAGSHVETGLFDAMMHRVSEEQRVYALAYRAQVIEQIREIKESQNGGVLLSGEDGQLQKVHFGGESFLFGREVFEEVVKREAVDQAVEGIGGYINKIMRLYLAPSPQKSDAIGGYFLNLIKRSVIEERAQKQIWCLLTGGTRLLLGLENRVKERIQEIGKASGVEIKFAEIAQPDFATVRGAVLRAVPERKPTPVPPNYGVATLIVRRKKNKDAAPEESIKIWTRATESSESWTKHGSLNCGELTTIKLEPGYYDVRARIGLNGDEEDIEIQMDTNSTVRLVTYAWVDSQTENLYVEIELD